MTPPVEPTRGVSPAAPPRDGIHHRLYRWVLSWSGHPRAVPALFALSFAEASFFLVPPDVLLMAMALARPVRARWYALVCTAGSVLGGLAGYAIGWAFWHLVASWVFDKLAFLGFTPENFALVQEKYDANAFLALFTAGFTPIPFKVFTIAAGVFEIGLLVFLAAATVGRAGRFFLVAELVARIGPRVQPFLERYLGVLTLAFAVLVILGFVAIRHLG